jgi:hypothetical protein
MNYLENIEKPIMWLSYEGILSHSDSPSLSLSLFSVCVSVCFTISMMSTNKGPLLYNTLRMQFITNRD